MSSSRERLEELLVECLERHESGGSVALELLLQQHPEHQAALRRYLRFLGDLNDSEVVAVSEPRQPAQQIADFRLLQPIGTGAMGEVWLAEQVSLARQCALKLVNLATISASSQERFRREAQALARIDSAHVVRVIASGEDENLGYLAMELVEGRGLDEVLKTKPEPILADLVRHARDVARALEAVHSVGLVHRDVKPSNIRISATGKAILLDFGLARDLSSSAPGLSSSGAFIGTPYYAAPEQLTGEAAEIGPHTDIYGLGVSLYECVTKQRPFAGSRPEQVFRQILTADPEPIQSLCPKASKDLVCVVTKAMEKEPERRYRSAAEFADDLDAVLELRPIRAQPLGMRRRLARWSRRHRFAASLVVLTGVAALLVMATVMIEGLKTRHERQQQAVAAVESAKDQLSRFLNTQQTVESDLMRRNEMIRLMPYRHLTALEVAELDRLERSLEGSQGNREEVFSSMLESLRRAEELDPRVRGLEDTRARVYLEQWRLARAAGATALARFYRERVQDADRLGRYRDDLNGTTRLVVKTSPSDAELHLFRIKRQTDVIHGGEFRNVAMAYQSESALDGTTHGPTEVQPGQFCLRVVRGAAEVPADAIITEIEGRPALAANALPWRLVELGGPTITLQIGDQTLSTKAPAGIELRPTANPFLITAASRVADPQAGITIPSGIWVLLVRRQGFMTRRIVLDCDSHTATSKVVHIELDPWGRVPQGFVRLQERGGQKERGIRWILDHEVTCADYLEFLNDPETQLEIDQSAPAIRWPRTESNTAKGGYWLRRADGRFQLGPDWQNDMPVLGLSHEDASAYARWKTKQLEELGFQLKLRLPEQYDYLCSSSTAQRFIWGDRFRPQWPNSCHSTSRPQVEAVMSYPVDETLGGLFDLSGSAQEWCEPWFAKEQNERMLHGGSWAHARAERFVLDFVAGSVPDHAADTFGFRLVAVPATGD